MSPTDAALKFQHRRNLPTEVPAGNQGTRCLSVPAENIDRPVEATHGAKGKRMLEFYRWGDRLPATP